MNITRESLTISTGRLFRNQNFIFILGIVLALTVGQGAVWTEPLVIPALAVSMTLSTISITNRDLTSMIRTPRPVFISFLLSYVVTGGITLFMARWLIDDSELWAGFVTLASAPPAIAVTPFTYMLGGNTAFSLIGTTGLYLIALGLTPGMMILFLGADFFSPLRVLLTLVQLIVVPLLISRLLLFRGLAQRTDRWRGTAVSWSIFIVIFTVIGLNRQVFFEQPDILLTVALIAITVTFGLGHAIRFVANRLHIDSRTSISWMVLGTRKNTGLSSAIALAFLGDRAAFPAAINSMVGILSVVWWGFYFKNRASKLVS